MNKKNLIAGIISECRDKLERELVDLDEMKISPTKKMRILSGGIMNAQGYRKGWGDKVNQLEVIRLGRIAGWIL